MAVAMLVCLAAHAVNVAQANCLDEFVNNDANAAITELSCCSASVGKTLPASLDKLTELQIIALAECNIIGQVPQSYASLTTLNVLSLEFNKLTGSLPAALADLANLEAVDVQGNQLTGTIPAGLATLTKLGFAYFGDNRFHPPMPTFDSNVDVDINETNLLFLGPGEDCSALETILMCSAGEDRCELTTGKCLGPEGASIDADDKGKEESFWNPTTIIYIAGGGGALVILVVLFVLVKHFTKDQNGKVFGGDTGTSGAVDTEWAKSPLNKVRGLENPAANVPIVSTATWRTSPVFALGNNRSKPQLLEKSVSSSNPKFAIRPQRPNTMKKPSIVDLKRVTMPDYDAAIPPV
jgi:Leucine-rich repeat (LRR) protein